MFHRRYHIKEIKYLLELVLKRKKRKSVTKHVFHASTSFLKRETVHPGPNPFLIPTAKYFSGKITFCSILYSTE